MPTNVDVARKDLRLSRQIDLYNEELVNLADATLSDETMKALRANKKMKLGQLNNLLGVALQSESVAPVTNWIQYQMGRNQTKEAWTLAGFGSGVLSDITTLHTFAQTISQDLYDSDELPLIGYVHLRLVRLYVGYLRRWFVARGGQQE